MGLVMGESTIESDANRRNLLLLIALRWLAVAGQVGAIAVVHVWLGVALPLAEMGLVILFLVGLNLIGLYRIIGQAAISDTELCVELLLDVAALTIQLYLSGGATNPFISLYLLQVILAAVLLAPLATWIIVAVTSACFIWLTRFFRPIDFRGHGLGLDGAHEGGHGAGSFFDLHLQGMFLCFLLASVLVALFVTRINANLRSRDAHLAELRQRAAEEAHIVRMGLLASGAAHELGTPLSTLAVILNDWQHMPRFRDDPELGGEIEEMQAALGRCKSIVSHILIASGEARGEDARRAPLAAFLDDMVQRWHDSRRPAALEYHNETCADVTIVCDSVIEQVLFNILDNALEASPDWVAIAAEQSGSELVVRVSDAGPGFSEGALNQFGKPYQTTKSEPGKSEPGRGLGLFLAVNVLRKLDGAIGAKNRPEGGALVEVRLPLSALAVGAHDGA
ncbi:ATP-binding protein [Xanthobacter autotrophicus]|uniref:ATP-binding protein n=1 Tax=Xanthobacter autotrophicus TaxID=280 RepID=UPI00372908C4